jgi:hypothetical protein
MKQTAVEWLAETLRFANKELYAEMYEDIEQAKKMERANIIDAYLINPLEAKWKNIGTDYYNETFNTKEK